MKIGIAGLGLIGGSMAKTIRHMTEHSVLGTDINPQVLKKAILLEAIDGELTDDNLKECSLVLIALYPKAAEQYLKQHADRFAPGTFVVDLCGVKQSICRLGRKLSKGSGWTFIGGHPMAGIEKSGFSAAIRTLFNRATMILTPPGDVNLPDLKRLKDFFLSLGFARIKISTPEEHDRIIAYTSQLAHVVSNAYIKSQAALEHTGFSAGSYKDLTRVATLEPQMWTELFLADRKPLLDELNGLIGRLTEYRDALDAGDADRLKQLLAEGRDWKAEAETIEKTEIRKLQG